MIRRLSKRDKIRVYRATNVHKKRGLMLPQKMLGCKTVIFFITIGGSFIIWGLYFALQPPFYPSEAEKKGATPSQVDIREMNTMRFYHIQFELMIRHFI